MSLRELPADLQPPLQAAIARRFERRSLQQLLEEAQIALALAAHFDESQEGFAFYDSLEDALCDEWLLNLPTDLVQAGLVTEGIEVAEAMARLDSGNAALYAGDLALSLAEAGHHEAAKARLQRLLRDFPSELSARMSAGHAYVAMGDPKAAEAHFRELVALARATEEVTDVEEAYQHLIEFFKGQPGRQLDAVAAQTEFAEWCRKRGWILANARLAPARSRTKVGRNEPCPCGSGRKYKRCCGAS